MENLSFSYDSLIAKAYERSTNIMRVLFDDYIYAYVTKDAYEKCCRGHNNSMVQVSGIMQSVVKVRIKTKGAYEKLNKNVKE